MRFMQSTSSSLKILQKVQIEEDEEGKGLPLGVAKIRVRVISGPDKSDNGQK